MKRELGIGIGIGIGIAAIAGLYYVNKSKKKNKLSELDYNTSSICKKELMTYGSIFEGLYEASYNAEFYEINEVDLKTLIFSWEARLEDNVDVANLHNIWAEVNDYSIDKRDVLKSWYRYLLDLGLTRNVDEAIVIKETLITKYELECDIEDLLDQKFIVTKAYWAVDDTVVEKGMIQLSEEEV